VLDGSSSGPISYSLRSGRLRHRRCGQCHKPGRRAAARYRPGRRQQGGYVARKILADLQGKATPPFRYRDLGSLATIGRNTAIVEMGRLRLTGFAAWIFWCVAHVYFLIGFRNRFSVALNWVWNYLTFQRSSRLITGSSTSHAEPIAVASAEVAVIARAVRDAA
jgi:hypothetical protein